MECLALRALGGSKRRYARVGDLIVVAVKEATRQLGEQQYAQALATLNTVSEEAWDEQLQELESKASDLLLSLSLKYAATSTETHSNLQGLVDFLSKLLHIYPTPGDLPFPLTASGAFGR